jgi:hypothetical protein
MRVLLTPMPSGSSAGCWLASGFVECLDGAFGRGHPPGFLEELEDLLGVGELEPDSHPRRRVRGPAGLVHRGRGRQQGIALVVAGLDHRPVLRVVHPCKASALERDVAGSHRLRGPGVPRKVRLSSATANHQHRRPQRRDHIGPEPVRLVVGLMVRQAEIDAVGRLVAAPWNAVGPLEQPKEE